MDIIASPLAHDYFGSFMAAEIQVDLPSSPGSAGVFSPAYSLIKPGLLKIIKSKKPFFFPVVHFTSCSIAAA